MAYDYLKAYTEELYENEQLTMKKSKNAGLVLQLMSIP